MQQRPRSRPLILLALLLSIGLVQSAEAQSDDFDLRGRQRMGDPATAAPYVVELWTTLETDRIREEDLPMFRFELYWRSNGTRAIPGPDLQLFAFRCDPPLPEEVGRCDARVQEDSEVGYLIRDTDDGVMDGVYPWEPEAGQVFGAEGDWAVELSVAGEPTENTALFMFETTALPIVPPFVSTVVRLVFGAEGSIPARIGIMFLWVLAFVLLGRGATRLARRTVLSPARVDPTVGRLAVRLFAAIWGILAVAWTLWVVWRINFWAGLTALGLLSVALGFGMQNTVANLMGGINLASDKPFIIGDRIKVGDTWGDVQEIGLRSTKIQTPRKEIVIVPNKLLDEQEIWNYTRDHQELRLDIDGGISYDSDWRLAEALMIQAAREHEAILSYPRPRVLMMSFGDSSVDLQLRCWLQAAKDARIVSSDLRKAIKDKWDEGGVEIPFPYRTLVNKEDLDPPRRARPEELTAITAGETRIPRMLYATAGPPQIHAIADFVGKIAHELDVALVVLYVTKPGSRVNRTEEYRVLSAFQDGARTHSVPLKTIHRKGDVVGAIKQVIKDEDIDLVAIGAHRYSILPTPRKMADFTKEIREGVHIPVLIVPRSLEMSTRTLNHYRALVEERHLAKERKRSSIVGEREAEAETLEKEELATGLPRPDADRSGAGGKRARDDGAGEEGAAPESAEMSQEDADPEQEEGREDRGR